MSKKQTAFEKRIQGIKKHVDVDAGKTSVSLDDITGNKSILDSLRQQKTPSAAYKTIKIKERQLNALKRIAAAEHITSYGKLLTAIIDDFVNKYDSGKL